MNKKKKGSGTIKLVISIVIVGLFIWFLVISPKITFSNNETKMKNAAKRYYELNSSELPVGQRVKTLTLTELYSKKYLDSDFYAPYSNKLCSQDNSWVKIRKNNNGSYDYIVYLDCGILQSNVDHEGPKIKLNGESSITIDQGSKFTDPGVKSVVDNTDNKINIKEVTTKGSVNTEKIGTYKIQYIAFDSLKNKTTVTRTVKVVKTIKSVVKKDLGNSTNYVGNPTNNFVRLSNMIFRIYGIDSSNNIILVSAEDIANVNFTKINEWLNNYYYEHLNENTKKMIVKSKYCNMKANDSTLDTTECNSYTKKVNVYIPSIVEVNRAEASDNFMKPVTISWVANAGDGSNAYVTRSYFFGEEYQKSFITEDKNDNYGVRPMFTIKGDSYIEGGNGTLDNPYKFNDSKKLDGGENIDKLSTGEYITISDRIYRVIDDNDGLVKVIADDAITNDANPVTFSSQNVNKGIIYNPQSKNSVAYFINNRVGGYVDTKYFVNHTINVPIYKDKIIYGEEVETRKYRAKLFAPNMYEMFSAQNNLYGHVSHSYWMLNSSKRKLTVAALTDIGVPINSSYTPYMPFGVRVCGYLEEDLVVTSGNGTHNNPYTIK